MRSSWSWYGSNICLISTSHLIKWGYAYFFSEFKVGPYEGERRSLRFKQEQDILGNAIYGFWLRQCIPIKLLPRGHIHVVHHRWLVAYHIDIEGGIVLTTGCGNRMKWNRGRQDWIKGLESLMSAIQTAPSKVRRTYRHGDGQGQPGRLLIRTSSYLKGSNDFILLLLCSSPSPLSLTDSC